MGIKISYKRVTQILFCLGLSLTIWRSYECLQKYFNQNLGTKVSMVKNNETFFPSIVVCPTKDIAYNLRYYFEDKDIQIYIVFNYSNLQKIGINTVDDYKNGNWYGNSSKSGHEIFLDVTHNISDLIEKFYVKHDGNGKRSMWMKCDHISCFNAREIGYFLFGRCFEIEIENRNATIDYIMVYIKKTVFMYVNLPNIFFNVRPKSKIQVNTVESLTLEATYEILQTNVNDNCKKYSQTYDQSFDECKFEVMANNLNTAVNCSVPFLFKENVTKNICKNETVAKRAFWSYARDLNSILPECPVPCVNMITSFVYPIVSKLGDNQGRVVLDFKNLVKVTEDFISYDLLRFISIFNKSYYIDCIFPNCSMVAEIGGYSGLLIGFSVMDLVVVLKSSMELLKRLTNFNIFS